MFNINVRSINVSLNGYDLHFMSYRDLYFCSWIINVALNGTFLTKESFRYVPISYEAIKIDFEYLIQWILTLERNIHLLSHQRLLESWSYHKDINKRYKIHFVLYICLNNSILETLNFHKDICGKFIWVLNDWSFFMMGKVVLLMECGAEFVMIRDTME